jgi:hypothetical protein
MTLRQGLLAALLARDDVRVLIDAVDRRSTLSAATTLGWREGRTLKGSPRRVAGQRPYGSNVSISADIRA